MGIYSTFRANHRWLREHDISEAGGAGGPAVTLSADPPEDPADGDLWLRLMDSASSYQLYISEGEGGWRPASAGVGGLPHDVSTRQVGILIGDVDDGNFTGLQVDQAQEEATLRSTDEDSNINGIVTVNANRVSMEKDFARLSVDADGWRLSGLPTEDPEIEAYLWNDAGTLKVSAGPGP